MIRGYSDGQGGEAGEDTLMTFHENGDITADCDLLTVRGALEVNRGIISTTAALGILFSNASDLYLGGSTTNVRIRGNACIDGDLVLNSQTLTAALGMLFANVSDLYRGDSTSNAPQSGHQSPCS